MGRTLKATPKATESLDLFTARAIRTGVAQATQIFQGPEGGVADSLSLNKLTPWIALESSKQHRSSRDLGGEWTTGILLTEPST